MAEIPTNGHGIFITTSATIELAGLLFGNGLIKGPIPFLGSILLKSEIGTVAE